MYGHDDSLFSPSDQDTGLWESGHEAVPPVIGRLDPYTGRPSMRYETDGEVAEETDGSYVTDEYDTDDGVNVTISF